MEKKTTRGSIGIFGLLTVVFITCKILGIDPIASWPWFSFNPFQPAVLMFLILWPLILLVIIGLIFALGIAIISFLEK